MDWSVPSPRRKRNVPTPPTWRIHHRHHPPHHHRRDSSSSTQTQVHQSQKSALTFTGSRRRHAFTSRRLFSRGKSLCTRSCLHESPVNICSVALIPAPWSRNLRGRQLRKERTEGGFARRVGGANPAPLLSSLWSETDRSAELPLTASC